MKRCRKCGEDKTFDDFYSGRAQCKACVKDRVKNHPNRKASLRAYHHRHKERLNAARVERQRGEDGSRQARWAQTPAGKQSRAAAEQRRRAAKCGAEFVKYDRMDVFDRDGGVCQLCNEPVVIEAVWPDPLFFTVDHITPLSKGGADVFDNVQTAHLRCNIAKGARTMEKIS